ncbi:MAG: hypothetical protein ACOCZJ_02445 [Thermoplasmatota archaeon]
MAKEINYLEDVELPPEDKDPKDYTFPERRRDILEEIKKHKDPKLLSRSDLAERYDVSIPMITEDIQAVIKSLEEYHGIQTLKTQITKLVERLNDEEEKRDIYG